MLEKKNTDSLSKNSIKEIIGLKPAKLLQPVLKNLQIIHIESEKYDKVFYTLSDGHFYYEYFLFNSGININKMGLKLNDIILIHKVQVTPENIFDKYENKNIEVKVFNICGVEIFKKNSEKIGEPVKYISDILNSSAAIDSLEKHHIVERNIVKVVKTIISGNITKYSLRISNIENNEIENSFLNKKVQNKEQEVKNVDEELTQSFSEILSEEENKDNSDIKEDSTDLINELFLLNEKTIIEHLEDLYNEEIQSLSKKQLEIKENSDNNINNTNNISNTNKIIPYIQDIDPHFYIPHKYIDNTQTITIEQLNHIRDNNMDKVPNIPSSLENFEINCKIKSIYKLFDNNSNLTYEGCQKCSKKLYADTYGYKCNSCNKIYSTPNIFFRLVFTFQDYSGKIELNILHTLTEKLFKIFRINTNAEQFRDACVNEDREFLTDLENKLKYTDLKLKIKVVENKKINFNNFSNDKRRKGLTEKDYGYKPKSRIINIRDIILADKKKQFREALNSSKKKLKLK